MIKGKAEIHSSCGNIQKILESTNTFRSKEITRVQKELDRIHMHLDHCKERLLKEEVHFFVFK